MRNLTCTWIWPAALCALLARPSISSAHGIVGDRFFPPTITTDDPFAADELALPTITLVKNAGSPPSQEIDAGFEFDKLIFPRFALGVSDNYITQNPDRGRGVSGWANLQLSAKLELWRNDEHEAIVSVGLKADLGRTGARQVGAGSFSTLAPTFYFGKGFGDLPDSLSRLRPLAITGTLDQTFPTTAEDSNAFEAGLAVEYSIPYLQQRVVDAGIPAPFKDMIPLVELNVSTPENRAGAGLTTASVNPGVLWETPHFQLGAEATIPVNGRSGAHVGAVVQVWIFIDDLFPHVFGHPLFGDKDER